jgi:hypothetical protein
LNSSSLIVALATCGSGDASGGGSESLSNPEVFESTMRASFVPMVAGISDGIGRLITALNGGPSDGVVLIPHAGGADATIAVDFDGDGSREGSINGSVNGDASTGASVVLADVASSEPSLNASGSLDATDQSPGVILLDNITGTGGADPDGHRNASDVEVTGGTVALDVVSGTPDGSVSMDVSGEGNTLGITVTFEVLPGGGYQVHFTGDGVDFTIP